MNIIIDKKYNIIKIKMIMVVYCYEKYTNDDLSDQVIFFFSDGGESVIGMERDGEKQGR